MHKRTKLAISALIAGASLSAALPAQAQGYGYRDGGYQDRHDRGDTRYDDRYERGDRFDRGHGYGQARAIQRQIEELRYRIERNDRRDRISEREAAGLRRAVWDLQHQFHDYRRDGLSPRETRRLQHRLDNIRDSLRYERRDRDGRSW